MGCAWFLYTHWTLYPTEELRTELTRNHSNPKGKATDRGKGPPANDAEKTKENKKTPPTSTEVQNPGSYPTARPLTDFWIVTADDATKKTTNRLTSPTFQLEPRELSNLQLPVHQPAVNIFDLRICQFFGDITGESFSTEWYINIKKYSRAGRMSNCNDSGIARKLNLICHMVM